LKEIKELGKHMVRKRNILTFISQFYIIKNGKNSICLKVLRCKAEKMKRKIIKGECK
jgi:hypothetical protein